MRIAYLAVAIMLAATALLSGLGKFRYDPSRFACDCCCTEERSERRAEPGSPSPFRSRPTTESEAHLMMNAL